MNISASDFSLEKRRYDLSTEAVEKSLENPEKVAARGEIMG